MSITKSLIVYLIMILSLLSVAYSMSINDPDYINIQNQIIAKGIVKVIVELNPDITESKPKSGKGNNDKIKIDKKLLKYDEKQVKDSQNKTIDLLTKFDKSNIKKGNLLPFIVLEVNSSNIAELLTLPQIVSVKEDLILTPSLSSSLTQIGVDVAHAQGYEGSGQAIAILDTGFESTHDMLTGKIISEACYSLNLCPGGATQTTAAGSSEACSGWSDCAHGTHVAGIAVGDNGVGLKGVAPKSKLIAINVFSDTGGPDLGAYTSDIILGLERVLELSSIYDISAVSMSLGGGSFAATCDGTSPQMTTVINALRAKGIPTIIASGNDGYTASINFPACISTAFSIGSVEDNDAVSGFSNSDELVDLLAPGGSIYSSVLNNLYATYAGTSMATPHVAGAWSVLKSVNPSATLDEIFTALTSTGTLIQDAKNGIEKPRINVDAALNTLVVPLFYGGSNVIDISVNEKVYEQVTYNPLYSGSGSFYDTSETQSVYIANGTILVKNNHPTETIQNILIDFKNIGNINSVSYLSGTQGYVLEMDTYFLHLQIPDLAPGQTTLFNYTINLNSIPPPLNFTTSYPVNKILAGGELKVYDKISNSLDSTFYNNTCIYNINILQNALDFTVNTTPGNFTFNISSLLGSDSTNASFSNNRTLNWNVLNNNCLYAENTTDINYKLQTPSDINIPDNYNIINTTISYTFNDTISQMELSRVKSSIKLFLKFDKKIEEVLTGDNATWKVGSLVSNPSNISVNLKKVSLWVSQRNGTGTGFTNPSLTDKDTISNNVLFKNYYPHLLLNDSTIYNNVGSEWMFNYTYFSSPILWMDIDHEIIDNNVQITDSLLLIGESYVYTKQVYIATGYFLSITKNITRLSDNNYSIYIEVSNKGPSIIPPNQVVMVYNFLPNTFNLTSNFSFMQSSWYTTENASTQLNDPTYNGTMHQFALLSSNIYNSSLAAYKGISNINNTWSLSYNVSGSGEFKFEDLFLTGVDPLHVESIGSTQAIDLFSKYESLSGTPEYILGTISLILLLVILFL